MKSPCANTYLDEVLEQVRPKLIVCVGKTVMAYLRWKFDVEGEDAFQVRLAGATVRVVRIAHPNDTGVEDEERERLLTSAMLEASRLIK